MNPLNEDQQLLVEDNIKLALKFSRRFQPPHGLNHDEWQAECMVFLVHAARRYDPSKSKFSTHAWISMRYGMFDYIREIQSVKKDYRRTQRIGEDEDLGAEDLSTERKIKLDECREQLLALIRRLPKPLWQEVWLKRMEGKDLGEICKEVQLSRVKIKNVYKDGLNYLQTLAVRSNAQLAGE